MIGVVRQTTSVKALKLLVNNESHENTPGNRLLHLLNCYLVRESHRYRRRHQHITQLYLSLSHQPRVQL